MTRETTDELLSRAGELQSQLMCGDDKEESEHYARLYYEALTESCDLDEIHEGDLVSVVVEGNSITIADATGFTVELKVRVHNMTEDEHDAAIDEWWKGLGSS